MIFLEDIINTKKKQVILSLSKHKLINFHRLSASIANETHTIEKLNSEKDHDGKLLQTVEGDNTHLQRTINKNQMFSPKEDEAKERAEEQKRRKDDLDELNEKIVKLDIEVTRENTRLNDRNLLKKQQEVNLGLGQDYSKIEIDMNIAKSRIAELEGLREMNVNMLRDMYSDKRVLEHSNKEI